MSGPDVTAPSRSISGGSEDRGSRSRGDEEEGGDDDPAETWAALESLPTYNRARTTVLEGGEEGGKIKKVDIKDVNVAQYFRTNVFKLNDADADNEIFLQKLRRRMDRVGVEQPTVEVRYHDLNVFGKVHLGSRALPTLWNETLNFLEGIFTSLRIMKSNKRVLTILDGVSGIIKPGRMTLLLGPPSAGKSTLLMALSGMLDGNLKVQGQVQYNGHTLDEFQPRKTSLYISQDDLHIAELTVRETMDYSARFQGVGSRYELLRELLHREKEQGIQPDPDIDFFMKATAMEDVSHEVETEYNLKIMGLDICADTIAGDQMRRGISGGQRKRLTTAEMIVGPAKVLFMDEISTGLDSTTTFKVVKCIAQNAHISKSTVLVSLLQPAPETYDLFDDLILISSGCIVYHGPLENVEEFFESCGFKCPARKHVADFLQEVTSFKNQEQYWMSKTEPYSFVPVKHFADAFKKFHAGQNIKEELATPFDKSQSHEAALVKKKWQLSQWDLFKIVFKKECLIVKKNYGLEVFIIIQLFIMSFITATVYFRTLRHHRNLSDAGQYSGALFLLLNTVTLLGFNEIVFLTLRKSIFHKLRKMQFYPPWAWAASMMLTKIPLALIEAGAAIIPCYYIIGFAPAASRFFKLWLILALSAFMSSGFFRMLGAFCPSPVIAGPCGGLAVMILFTLSGYILPRTQMKDWLVWTYWLFPLSYPENGVLANEFLAHQWKRPYRDSGHSVGHAYMLAQGFYDRGFWYWLACGVLIAYAVGFYIVCALTLEVIGAEVYQKAFKEKLDGPQFGLIQCFQELVGRDVEYVVSTVYRWPKTNFSSVMAVVRWGSADPEKTKAIVSAELLAERNRDKTGEGIEQYTVAASRLDLPRSISTSLNSGSPSMIRRESLRIEGADALEQAEMSTSRKSVQSGQSSNFLAERAPKRGMIMPFQPLSIAFSEINYFVDMPSDTKQAGIVDNKLQLLKKITGVFRPGVLTALVGVTGAGKSTLMDVLSGRKTRGYIEGEIFINGFSKKQETFARIAGYCEQNDIHTAPLTIQESLVFSAWLRLPSEISPEMKMDFVAEVIELVELTSLREALVGVPGETGLSTEQRKRLTIAVELVANPSIVFMDEPTSGLDARAAAAVMRAVRNTVDTGRTVVCTIHQPSIDIFESFDELLLLKRGGETIYAGPLGRNSHRLIEYFEKIEGIPKIRNGYNPAAWMLEITTPGMETKLEIDFAQLYRQSSIYEQVKALVAENSVPPPNTEDLTFPTKHSQNLWVQFTCCLWKQHWTYWRSPGYNLSRFFLSFASSIYFGIAFWGLGKDVNTQTKLYSVLGATFTSQLFYGILTSSAAQPTITASRVIFYRERSAGMYDEFPYALAMNVIELPYVIASSAMYSIISYSMIQFKWHADKFFWYLFFTFCSQFTSILFGMVMVALTPNPAAAQILCTFTYNMWTIFSGFMLPHNKFPVWWRWFFWVQPISYHVYGTIVSQFGDQFDSYIVSREGVRHTIPDLLRQEYGYGHSELGFVATMSIMCPFVISLIFILAIKYINYQQR